MAKGIKDSKAFEEIGNSRVEFLHVAVFPLCPLCCSSDVGTGLARGEAGSSTPHGVRVKVWHCPGPNTAVGVTPLLCALPVVLL